MMNGWLRKLLTALALMLVTDIAAIWLLAPQVMTLAGEGFPSATWPAPGSYSTVEGRDSPVDPAAGQPIPAASALPFRDSGGRALLMAQDGKLLIETYGPGLDRETRLNSYSMVKSLVGAMILRGVADGSIRDLDDPLSAYLGNNAPAVSIRQALTMTSGLRLGEHPEKTMEDGAFSPFGGLARMHAYGLDAIMPDLHPNPI